MVQVPDFGPSDLLTSETPYKRRVKTEQGDTAYDEGVLKYEWSID